jgi:hypothetical protein
LIKKMRLKKIATYEKANAFLAGSYLQQHNSKYAVTAREKADFHLAVGTRLDLNQIFCLEEERKVSNDWVVQYGKRWLQIEAEQKNLVGAGSAVVVREHRDGGLTLLQGGAVVRWHELGQRPKAAAPLIQRRVVTRPKPAPDHPWRKPIHAAQGR